MSVQWSCGDCPAYVEADKHPEDSKEWREFASLRESMIWALLITGFPPKSEWAITENNWREVFARLRAVEQVSGPYRCYHRDKSDGGIRKVYFTPAEVRSMVGLRVNAGSKSKHEFLKWIEGRLTGDADNAIARYEKLLEVTSE